jgi:hypothetical protein
MLESTQLAKNRIFFEGLSRMVNGKRQGGGDFGAPLYCRGIKINKYGTNKGRTQHMPQVRPEPE